MWETRQTENESSLHRSFEFSDFISAFGFLTQVAILAEKHNHHPKLTNVYNKVSIALSTHDAGNQITQKDKDLAKAIDALVP